MSKVIIFWLSCFAVIWSLTANGQETDATPGQQRFVRTDLYIFMHAGPGRQYRILGSVNAGSLVQLEESEVTGDFIEVTDENGRTGWVEEAYLTNDAPQSIQLEDITEQLNIAQQALEDTQQELNAAQSELAEQKKRYKTLSQAFDSTSDELTTMQSQLTDQTAAEQTQWMLNGGGLVGGGVVLGLLLTYLPRRRQRRDGWID